jgi:hypothetical protein
MPNLQKNPTNTEENREAKVRTEEQDLGQKASKDRGQRDHNQKLRR